MKDIMDDVDRIVGRIVAGSLLVITVTMAFNVVGRYLFGYSLKWGEELTNYVIIGITFVGYGLCISRDMDMKIDLLEKLIPCSVARWLRFLSTLVALAFTLMLVFIGFKHVQITSALVQFSPALRLPMYIPYIVIPVGAILISIKYLLRAINLLRPDLTGGQDKR